MAYPDQLTKVEWHFALNNGVSDVEEAVPGVWIHATTAIGAPDVDAFLASLSDQVWEAWATNLPEGDWTAVVRLASVRCAMYDTALKTTNVVVKASGGTSWTGSSSGPALPWQVSQVVGLYTYTPGGFIAQAPTRRGRVYLPPPASSVLDSGNTGQMDQTKATAVMTAFKACLHDVVASIGGVSLEVGVVSRKRELFFELTDLTTDVKLDTQRRRTHSEDVARLTTAF